MENTIKKISLEIPEESQRIYKEYFRFVEYCNHHGWYTPLLRDFIQSLEDKGLLTTTEDGLYKIKDGVEITYKN